MDLLRGRRARPVRTVIVGAGIAGRLVLEEIQRRSELNALVRGFVDDNRALHGQTIGGIPVLGGSPDLSRLKEEHALEEAIIAMPSVEGPSVRKIVDLCRRAGLVTQIIPGVVDVLSGRANVSAARPVTVEDLLRRETVVLSGGVTSAFAGKTVFVTGAAGSIGSELCRTLVTMGIERLVALDTDENGIFELDLELRPPAGATRVALEPVVGSILNGAKLDWILATFRPQVVFHAAARKHVPLMERHPEEAVETNVVGTRLVGERCAANGVEAFVHVSTDKAVEPVSVMGASKRISEMLLQGLAARSTGTRFITVRFGNVIGSRGSVLDVFRRQLAAGGPITITDPRMTRYFMSANEAAVLLVQAVALGNNGDLLVLDMGEPVRVLDLVRDLITLSGYSGDDVEVRTVGARPGEKLREELHGPDEALAKTAHPRILRVIRGAGSLDLDAIDALTRDARAMARESLADAILKLARRAGRGR